MNAPRTTAAARAADWLVRRDRGFTPAEQDEFHAWLAAAPQHRAAFAREEATWSELDRLADWRPEHGDAPNPDVLAPPRRLPLRPLLRFAPLAAAAGLAVAFFIFRPAPPPAVVSAEAVAVATGYERRVLADGSIAELNRGAALSVRYTAGERRVRLLRGEAHFTVVPGPGRPFVVDAAGIEARAVGTAFHVSLAGEAVAVLVTEGRVQVGPASAPPATAARAPDGAAAPSRPAAPDRPILAAGERLVVSASAPPGRALVPVAVPPAEIDRTLAWQPKLLEFAATPLADVVAAFNRHNVVRLELADPALAGLPIVATFRSDNVDGFVRLLGATAGVQAERTGDTILLRGGKSR